MTGPNLEPDDCGDDHPWLEDGFLTTVEACGILRGAIPLDIRRWCHKGFIRYVKEECSGKYLVCEADVKGIAAYCDGRPATLSSVSLWSDGERRTKQ